MFKFCLLVVTALALSPETVKGQLVGATDAAPGEFPYHVLLKLNGEFFCNGALITPRHVLTAGHCVFRVKEFRGLLSATVGTISRTSGGQSYRIVGRIFHTRYVHKNPPEWMYDIGIFTLESNVAFSSQVALVNLPKSDNVRTSSWAVISAVGCTKHEGPLCDVLQKLHVAIVDIPSCQVMLNPQKIDNTHICTFAGVGKGTCGGDSGAPLVQDGVLIGIASGGIPCARGYPDVFTKVYEYLLWINEVFMDSSGSSSGGSSSRGSSSRGSSSRGSSSRGSPSRGPSSRGSSSRGSSSRGSSSRGSSSRGSPSRGSSTRGSFIHPG